MPEQLKFETFPLLVPEADTNDMHRPGTIVAEYHEVTFTIDTNTDDIEVPTALGQVLGLIPLHYSSVFDTGDCINDITTDGVITNGAVTVRINTTSIANGALTTRILLLGYKAETVLLNSPNPA